MRRGMFGRDSEHLEARIAAVARNVLASRRAGLVELFGVHLRQHDRILLPHHIEHVGLRSRPLLDVHFYWTDVVHRCVELVLL